jgi:hypothetical protein
MVTCDTAASGGRPVAVSGFAGLHEAFRDGLPLDCGPAWSWIAGRSLNSHSGGGLAAFLRHFAGVSSPPPHSRCDPPIPWNCLRRAVFRATRCSLPMDQGSCSSASFLRDLSGDGAASGIDAVSGISTHTRRRRHSWLAFWRSPCRDQHAVMTCAAQVSRTSECRYRIATAP